MSSVLINTIAAGALMGCVYALIATGLTLVFGVMRIVNIAHGEMVVIGMYVGYWCHELFGLSILTAVPVAAVSMFLLGSAVHRLLIERVMDKEVHVQFLLFIGLALAITGLQVLLFSPNAKGIMSEASFAVYRVAGLRLDATKVHAGLAALALMAAFALWLRFSLIGKAIRACAANRTGAAAVGIKTAKMCMIAAGIASACAGAAGALIAPVFDTTPYLGHEFTLLAFIVVVIGGLGNFPGALLGGVLIGIAENLAALTLNPSLKSLFSYGILILILLFRPYGILGQRGVS